MMCGPTASATTIDSRVNLELNLGGKNGSLNKWIEDLSQQGHKTYMACDNMFANAVLGGGLDPKSTDNISIYALETTTTRSDVGQVTGVSNQNNTASITLLSNINIRGVRGGNFQVKFDGPKLEPITLNVTHAETISAPPESFDSTFPHILDGVALNSEFPEKLTVGLKSALGWTSDVITYYELEKAIWNTHWRMHVLCRKDTDPRNCDEYLLNNESSGSNDITDYRFGLLDSEIQTACRPTPWLDATTLCTEGGEHCHYLHQCQRYAHSSRGGGWHKEEAILAIFKWTYRRLRERIEEGEEHAKQGFERFVKQCFQDSARASGTQTCQPENISGEEPQNTESSQQATQSFSDSSEAEIQHTPVEQPCRESIQIATQPDMSVRETEVQQ
ncbi:hypothetical protein AC249_AIPGENE25438, partial [Exaiptasia diaphana]